MVRKKETQMHELTDRQTERKEAGNWICRDRKRIDRIIETWTGRKKNRCMIPTTNNHTGRHMDRNKDEQMDGWMDRQMSRRTERKTTRQMSGMRDRWTD